jgi:hypothetical protein
VVLRKLGPGHENPGPDFKIKSPASFVKAEPVSVAVSRNKKPG